MNERPFKFGLAIAVLITIVLCTIMWVKLTQQHQQLRQAQVMACRQVEALKTVVRQEIVQSEHLVGRPGSPGYAYYRQHPSELQAARGEAQRELAEFAPGHC